MTNRINLKKNTRIYKKKAAYGFTLIEMIAVILILAVTTVVGSNIVISLIKGQSFIKKQSQVLMDSQLTMDRLTKQLRLALPFSLRESNGSRCLSFLPIVSSGFYLDELPDESNGFTPAGRDIPITVSPHNIFNGVAHFFSVGAGSPLDLYGSTPPSLAAIQARSITNITLDQNHRWRRNSPEQRFFITDQAQAFCIVNNQLRYYKDIAQQNAQINLNRPYDLLMNSIGSTGRAFQVGSSGNCEHCIDIQLVFMAQDIELEKKITVALLYAP